MFGLKRKQKKWEYWKISAYPPVPQLSQMVKLEHSFPGLGLPYISTDCLLQLAGDFRGEVSARSLRSVAHPSTQGFQKENTWEERENSVQAFS